MMLRSSYTCLLAIGALGALGCSDPVEPPAKGAANIHVRSASGIPSGYQCNIPAHIAQIGDKANPSREDTITRVTNGKNGATVECTVKGSGTYSVTAKLNHQKVSLSLQGSISAGGTGEAFMASFDPTSATSLATPDDKPCTLSVETAPLQVAAGRLWATFNCPVLQDDGAPTTTYCAADGVILVENCKD